MKYDLNTFKMIFQHQHSMNWSVPLKYSDHWSGPLFLRTLTLLLMGHLFLFTPNALSSSADTLSTSDSNASQIQGQSVEVAPYNDRGNGRALVLDNKTSPLQSEFLSQPLGGMSQIHYGFYASRTNSYGDTYKSLPYSFDLNTWLFFKYSYGWNDHNAFGLSFNYGKESRVYDNDSRPNDISFGMSDIYLHYNGIYPVDNYELRFGVEGFGLSPGYKLYPVGIKNIIGNRYSGGGTLSFYGGPRFNLRPDIYLGTLLYYEYQGIKNVENLSSLDYQRYSKFSGGDALKALIFFEQIVQNISYGAGISFKWNSETSIQTKNSYGQDENYKIKPFTESAMSLKGAYDFTKEMSLTLSLDFESRVERSASRSDGTEYYKDSFRDNVGTALGCRMNF